MFKERIQAISTSADALESVAGITGATSNGVGPHGEQVNLEQVSFGKRRLTQSYSDGVARVTSVFKGMPDIMWTGSTGPTVRYLQNNTQVSVGSNLTTEENQEEIAVNAGPLGGDPDIKFIYDASNNLVEVILDSLHRNRPLKRTGKLEDNLLTFLSPLTFSEKQERAKEAREDLLHDISKLLREKGKRSLKPAQMFQDPRITALIGEQIPGIIEKGLAELFPDEGIRDQMSRTLESIGFSSLFASAALDTWGLSAAEELAKLSGIGGLLGSDQRIFLHERLGAAIIGDIFGAAIHSRYATLEGLRIYKDAEGKWLSQIVGHGVRAMDQDKTGPTDEIVGGSRRERIGLSDWTDFAADISDETMSVTRRRGSLEKPEGEVKREDTIQLHIPGAEIVALTDDLMQRPHRVIELVNFKSEAK